MPTLRSVVVAVIAVLSWVAVATAQAPPAASASPAEVALAERYAPVVMLQNRPGENDCREGEPFQPIDVDLILGNDEVVLRGPWDRTNIVKIAPEARDLAGGLWGYHLDFPGDPLRPECTYTEWAERLSADSPATTYARVNAEPGKPGLIALQYWFYYVFNDWNNTHEADWEMIQIIFPAGSAEEALGVEPLEVGYSQHSSAERAEWCSEKLELVDGTHPVVYPAAGSHANFFSNRVYLMRSEAEGVGCDDAGGQARVVRPVVSTVPNDRADYLGSHPWLGFEGRWGEQQAGVFNGPTGPNDKLSWTQPITWSQTAWRDTSFTVPSGGGLVGTRATDFFCTAIGAGSEVLRRTKANPVPVLAALALLAGLLIWGISRTRWSATSPADLRRRRAWGQLLTTSALMMRTHPRTFLGIGLLFLPLGLAITGLQWVLLRLTALDSLLTQAGDQFSIVASLALVIGVFFAVLGLVLVHAATARAVVRLAGGEPTSALSAYRSIVADWRALVPALLLALAAQVLLGSSLILIPLAIYLLVRWALFAVVVGAEGDPRPGPLRRTMALTRGNWWRVAGIVVGVTGAALVVGPAVGVITLIGTGMPFLAVNLIATAIYIVAMPLAALAMVYLYLDLAARERESIALADASSGRPPASPGPIDPEPAPDPA